MNSRKGMKLILPGAALLILATLSVSADPIEEEHQDISTVSIDRPTEELPLDQDASKGERDYDDMGLPPGEEDLIICPYEGDEYENLISPAPGAEGDVFILDTIGADLSAEQDETKSSNLMAFPPLMIALFLAFIGIVVIVGKKTE